MLNQLTLLSGSSYLDLGTLLSLELQTKLGKVKKLCFPDGETGIELEEQVLRKNVFILQSCTEKPDHYFMELLLMIDAAKRAGAKDIGVILPYFPYCRQDRISKPGEPISARVIAECLEAVGVTHMISFDLHQGQLEGFFNVPFLQLTAKPILYEKIRELQLENLIIVAPDAGSAKIARKYAEHLKVDFVVVDKFRGPKGIEMRLIGSVEGCNVLLVDDICSTASTLTLAADLCKKEGATGIFAAVTHGLFVGDAIQKIEDSPIEKVYTTNTVPKKLDGKIEQLSVAKILSEGIKAVLQ